MTRRQNNIDAYVSKRIREARTELGITQQALSTKVGVTFQQIQKYENGTNRVSAGRLFQIAQVFDVPITYFFEGAPKPKSL